VELSNYIKYCLGYIRLTRQRTFLTQERGAVALAPQQFNLTGLLNLDLDGRVDEPVNLPTFSRYDPADVPAEEQAAYEAEQQTARQIETLYNQHRNNEFTRQVDLRFGYFEIELPAEEGLEEAESSKPPPPPTKTTSGKTAKGLQRFPLFSVPVRIEKDGKQLALVIVDPEIQVNVGNLEPLLGDSYDELIRRVGEIEMRGGFELPAASTASLEEVWQLVRGALATTEARFNADSFRLNELRLAIVSKSNYFLADDLRRLARMTDPEVADTSLTAWVSDDKLCEWRDPPPLTEQYFPFPYDRYQVRALSIIDNRAAIVQGPPGTGKSQTICNLICHLVARGEKVLFVSQKAQALKVVKDRLKKLGIPNLYGYIPNPGSGVLTEEDERDGAGPQLARMQTYLADLQDGRKARAETATLASVMEAQAACLRSVQAEIDRERRYCRLLEEYNRIRSFQVSLRDPAAFTGQFTADAWESARRLRSEIEALDQRIPAFPAHPRAAELEAKFKYLRFGEKPWAAAVRQVRDQHEQCGYDRHSALMRRFQNWRQRRRLSAVRQPLPREILDEADAILSQPTSRMETVARLDEFLAFLERAEAVAFRAARNLELENLLFRCGLDVSVFQQVEALDSGNTRESRSEAIAQVNRAHQLAAQIRAEFEGRQDVRLSAGKMDGLAQERQKAVAEFIRQRLDERLLAAWQSGVRIRQITSLLGKAFGQSRRAYKTFDRIRREPENFHAILDLVPVWIMELDDASRIIPLKKDLFDHVIMDEASQCNIAYALPAMYRGKSTILVGDSEQMRDSTVLFKSNRAFDELAARYAVPDTMQIKATGESVQSVIDIAVLRGVGSVTLQFHYRSPAELIEFSNAHFYRPKGKGLVALNRFYRPFPGTNRILLVHPVTAAPPSNSPLPVNPAEAEGILELYRKIRADASMRDLSVGVLSFFNEQAALIRETFEKAGFKEDGDRLKISIVEGIQGDEKDVIIYSLVISRPEEKNRYVPLTGEGGDLRAAINAGRVNVAFSRARQQTHCFTTLPAERFPRGIWIREYLDQALAGGTVPGSEGGKRPFESGFEEEAFAFLNQSLDGQPYRIENQAPTCGFRIDLVVTNTANGRSVAVECDGPVAWEKEALPLKVENDVERQQILQTAGWRFLRLRYSDWMDPAWDRADWCNRLKELL
jgi:very-short-patch-repair endonuclease